MSRKYKIIDQSALHFVKFTVIHRLDVFIRQEYRDIFLDKHSVLPANKALEVCAYCVMTSHVRMIIGRNGKENLQDIIRDVKKFTSSKIIEASVTTRVKAGANYLCAYLNGLARETPIILTFIPIAIGTGCSIIRPSHW